MADVTVKVLEEATYKSFLSLDEAKAMLGLPATGGDPAADVQLQFQIDAASAIIFRLCNRPFAKTKVLETWRGNTHPVIYLRLWPVKDQDVLGIGNGGPSIWPPPGGFDLENHTGKLRVSGDPISVTYSGGYELPDEAPDDLKHACLLLIRTQRTEATRESVEGIRMLAHKESRVIFFDPNAAGAKTSSAALSGSSGHPTVDALLEHYCRDWM
jgi:hypothetical protein